jgi:hypothetical protein
MFQVEMRNHAAVRRLLRCNHDDGSADPANLWAIELTSPGNLTRLGWSRTSVKPGDRIEVEMNPLRDGKHGGGFKSLKLSDTGQVLRGRLIDIESGGTRATP